MDSWIVPGFLPIPKPSLLAVTKYSFPYITYLHLIANVITREKTIAKKTKTVKTISCNGTIVWRFTKLCVTSLSLYYWFCLLTLGSIYTTLASNGCVLTGLSVLKSLDVFHSWICCCKIQELQFLWQGPTIGCGYDCQVFQKLKKKVGGCV